ncbi:peptidoglycan-binding protein [Streptomyces sp. NPDC046197]|uniref:peptidoglycan-binding protein n=1 Tax=Streptomyces sp. NPDC046197 TaxID=3154337 RepID=UPI0033CFCFD8
MSTPPGHEQPHGGPPLEPIRVIRPRRTDALAELMREFRGDTADHESVEWPARAGGADDATQELPPVAAAGSLRRPPSPPRDAHATGPGVRRAALAIAVAAAALAGFAGALLLPGRGEADEARAPHPTASSGSAATPAPSGTPPGTGAPAATGTRAGTGAPATTGAPTGSAAVDPDGPGTLREGDFGPEVTELQERLLRIPDIYRNGSTSGRYDADLKAAVARYQLWYGISGDETGVYGDDTRRSLESRYDG